MEQPTQEVPPQGIGPQEIEARRRLLRKVRGGERLPPPLPVEFPASRRPAQACDDQQATRPGHEANTALEDLKAGRVVGRVVLDFEAVR